jgi:hypothetical protein
VATTEKDGKVRLAVLGAARPTAVPEGAPGGRAFHIGAVVDMDGYGEVLPVVALVDDNLSRYVLADRPATSWHPENGAKVFALPNRAVAARDGVFFVTGAGEDVSEPNPNGPGRIHVVHLGSGARLWDAPGARAYVYRLESFQSKPVRSPK